MKKLFLSLTAALALLAALPTLAAAQDYSYDCLCLYSDPNGSCVEYTCDAYQRSRRSSYYDNYYNDCGRSGTYYDGCRSTYDYPYYRSSRSYGNLYDDSRYNYDWYYNRYQNRSPYRRYYNQYYDNGMYYY